MTEIVMLYGHNINVIFNRKIKPKRLVCHCNTYTEILGAYEFWKTLKQLNIKITAKQYGLKEAPLNTLRV